LLLEHNPNEHVVARIRIRRHKGVPGDEDAAFPGESTQAEEDTKGINLLVLFSNEDQVELTLRIAANETNHNIERFKFHYDISEWNTEVVCSCRITKESARIYLFGGVCIMSAMFGRIGLLSEDQ